MWDLRNEMASGYGAETAAEGMAEQGGYLEVMVVCHVGPCRVCHGVEPGDSGELNFGEFQREVPGVEPRNGRGRLKVINGDWAKGLCRSRKYCGSTNKGLLDVMGLRVLDLVSNWQYVDVRVVCVVGITTCQRPTSQVGLFKNTSGLKCQGIVGVPNRYRLEGSMCCLAMYVHCRV